MSDATISSILSQIRALQGQATARPAAPAAAKDVTPGSFGETLQRAVGRVNGEQQEAARLAKAFELGDPQADLARVMIAQQTAQVSFRAAVEVRNRLVQAYQDVMNMPL